MEYKNETLALLELGKGNLLAGDSGRKIAEVIDLQGAIYHRGCERKREEKN